MQSNDITLVFMTFIIVILFIYLVLVIKEGITEKKKLNIFHINIHFVWKTFVLKKTF